MKQHQYLRGIVILGLLIALNIILTRFASIQTPLVRIGFGFLPIAIAGIMYGPWRAGIAGAIGDIIGISLMPIGEPFFGFTLTAFLTGFIFGYVLHGKEVNWTRCTIASLGVVLICNLCLDTYWLYLLYNKGLIAILPFRLIKSAITLPIYVVMIHVLWNRFLKPLHLHGFQS